MPCRIVMCGLGCFGFFRVSRFRGGGCGGIIGGGGCGGIGGGGRGGG